MTLPPGTPALDVLDLLVSVAETGSLGSAAKRHGISQPAASMRISALERRLRLTLLDRGPSGSRLTDAGHAVVSRTRPVLAAVQDLLDGVAALHDAHPARLRVVASQTIADHRIPLWLNGLRGAYPEFPVSLEVANSLRAAESVRSGAADLGFVEGPRPPADLGSRVVGSDELVIVVGPGHPWARRARPVTLRQLAGTPLFLREPGSGTRDTVWEVLSAECQPATPAAELASSAALRAAARTGAAPAVLSRLIAAPDLAAGSLVEIAVARPAALMRRFHAVWRHAAPPTGPAEALLAIAEGKSPGKRPE
ncbi:MAG: LysR family transcriptional regulator [Mycobacteriaceae bacterium]|nr:LysR family transcriptional regulator [Mycobacteriaceae bacterium]